MDKIVVGFLGADSGVSSTCTPTHDSTVMIVNNHIYLLRRFMMIF
jgi:hypothetical protein